ncbi:MAG: ATP-binding cassette domain-containing protein [Actinomycetota bacterium]
MPSATGARRRQESGRVTVDGIISADRLTKFYGHDRGVEDLSFSVGAGEVFGFLGPNGAGKTTTIRTMLDFIRPTSGAVRLFGLDAHHRGPEIHTRVGYLPGELALYERLTGERYLRDFAAFRGGIDLGYARDLATRLGLDLTKRIRELSHGNKQKVGLVQAFMHRPDLLVMDEPTQGLDPLVQQTFYAMLDEERERGTTVFLSSHVMPEVERVCDRVGIIREGRLATVSDIGDLKSRVRRRIELHFEGPAPRDAFAQIPGVRGLRSHGDELSLEIEGSVDPVIKEAARHTVINVATHEPSLEELFLTYFDPNGEAPDGDDDRGMP